MKITTIKCPNCGANIEIEEGRNSFFCSYCGNKIILDDEKKEITINKNISIRKDINTTNRYIDDAEIIKARNKEKANKREWISIIVGLVIALAIPLCMIAKSDIEEKNAKNQGKVSVGYSDSLEGEDYESVVAHFESAGFTNIELIDLNDSGLAFWKEGKVESISIAGDNYFSSDDYFDPNSKVVISYH